MVEKKYSQEEVDLRIMAHDIKGIKKSMEKIQTKLDEDYVTAKEFKIVRTIVFGMVGIILTGFLGAVVTLVFGGGK